MPSTHSFALTFLAAGLLMSTAALAQHDHGRAPPAAPAESAPRAKGTVLVNLVEFPPLKPGKDAEFRKWFAWSNGEYAKHKGFLGRRLLAPRNGGNYAAIVEHESFETFMAMHTSPTQAEAHKRVEPLFEGKATPKFYEVVLP